jgi:hypothetical protein
VFRPVLLPDRQLLSALSLLGEFRQVPDVLWYREASGPFSHARQRQMFFPGRAPAHLAAAGRAARRCCSGTLPRAPWAAGVRPPLSGRDAAALVWCSANRARLRRALSPRRPRGPAAVESAS